MPNVYQAGLVQIRPRYTNEVDGDKTENVMWFSGALGSGDYTLSQLIAVQNTFDPLMATVWKNVAVSSASYIGSVITGWTSSAGLSNDNTSTFTPVAGVAGGSGAPAQVCVLYSESIATRFKGGHGRIYLPWIGTNSSFASSALPAGYISSVNSNMAALWAGMAAISSPNGGPFLPEIYRYRNDPAKASVHQVVFGRCSPVWATQRRRLRKAPHH